MDTIRQQKIGRLIQKELSELLQKDIKHLCQNALVTVTNVNVTADLSISKVYLSVFSTDNKESIIKNFNSNTSEIRYLIGKLLKNQIRHIPEFHFYIDDTLDYIERIDKALGNK